MAGQAVDLALLKDVLVVLGTAGVVVPLMHRLKVGPVLGFLLAGAVLGPYGLARFAGTLPWLHWVTVVNREELAGIADFGVVFLLFVLGLELSVARLVSMRRLVFGLGSLQVIVSAAVLAAAALELGEKPAAAAVLGACLALSSTAVVVEVLAEQKRLTTTTGRTAFAVLLFQDLAVIPILFMVETLGAARGSDPAVWSGLGFALLQGLVAIAVIVAVGRSVLRPLFRIVAETRSAELFMATILFVAIGTGVVTALAGMSMALGAFVAGLLLAETEYRRAIEAVIEPFKGLLLGVFFFSVGMSLDLDFVVAHPVSIVAGAFGLVAIKGVVTALGARLFGVPPSHAVKTGLLIGAGGEFAFIVVTLAGSLGLVGKETAAWVLAVVSVSMAAIPLFDLVGRRLSREIDRRAPPDPALLAAPPEDAAPRALIVGYGRVGRLVAAMLDAHGVPWIAADRDAGNVVDGRRADRPVYFGDAAHPLFLRSCGIETAPTVIVTMHDTAGVDAVVEMVRAFRPEVPLVARARDADHARRLYRKGVTDAVPETIEASLQLSEAALVGLGVAMGPIIASIHEKRDEFRRELSRAAEASPAASAARKGRARSGRKPA